MPPLHMSMADPSEEAQDVRRDLPKSGRLKREIVKDVQIPV